MPKTVQNVITLQVKVVVSPLGASGEEVKEVIEELLDNLPIGSPAYSVHVEVISEEEEIIETK